MRSLSMIVAAGLALGLPAAAHAEWYAGADLGASWLPDQKADFSNGTHYKADHQTGPVGLGQLGYDFGGLKLEGELGVRNNDIERLKNRTTTSGANNASGSTTVYSLMGNAIYDFNATGAWHPFLGAGIGAAYVDIDKVADNDGVNVYSGNDWRFAYQGFAGLGYDLDANWTLKGQYRYFATLDGDVSLAGSGIGGDAEYKSHEVLIGLTYRFGAPQAAVAAATPAPAKTAAPIPAPAPVVQNFMVFFDFDKATLTPEAQTILNKAAVAFKSGKKPRIDLTGHADRAGSETYNMKLSKRRADAVKAALVRLGVPAAEIGVAAKGESAPLVQTPDGVREPQNRRVEIVLP
ncbi:MAG: OmpA family protein [Rhodospirillaceae bacterium]